MKSYRFRALLQNDGWLENVTVSLDDEGKIVSISNDETDAEFINGYALPAFQNAHSHAFQYAMAGLAENHLGEDDFWSWREQAAFHICNIFVNSIVLMLLRLYYCADTIVLMLLC